MKSLAQVKPQQFEEVPATSELAWFVAHVRPRCEKRVARYCDRINVTALLPLYQSVRKYRKKTVSFHKPLFPGYVFLRTSVFDRGRVYQSDYVANILTVHDQVLFEQQLVDILHAIDTGLEVILAPAIRAGSRVVIRSGPLAGIEGWVEERYGSDTVLLRLDFIGKAAAVKINADQLTVI